MAKSNRTQTCYPVSSFAEDTSSSEETNLPIECFFKRSSETCLSVLSFREIAQGSIRS